MKERNHEVQLPEGYREVYRINALEKKTGIILNLVALLINAAVVLIALIPFFIRRAHFTFDYGVYMISFFAFIAAMILYIVLHELTHGLAYKLLTREKLTYGFSWSCAYCGVPNIYVYRRAALISLLAPLVTFTVILVPITALLYFVHPIAYLAAAILLGMHLGGCSGDMYLAILFFSKFKDKTTIMRDTGPEQFIYQRVGSASESEEA